MVRRKSDHQKETDLHVSDTDVLLVSFFATNVIIDLEIL